MTDPQELSELHWTAFQYASGDLNETDMLAFEERLLTDQTAREAVAAAVELRASIKVSARSTYDRPVVEVADRSSSRWLAPAGWAAAGAAACLLIVLAVYRPDPLNDGMVPMQASGASNQLATKRTLQLALAWADVRSIEQEIDPSATVVEDVAAVSPGAGDSDADASYADMYTELEDPAAQSAGMIDDLDSSWIVAALSDDDSSPPAESAIN